MITYETRELYGGAITVQLPEAYIDASDLRQIPDHQEVFMSPTTLTSLIFEINEYVQRQNDTAAVHFHFSDVIAMPDRLAEALTEPKEIILPATGLKKFSAYVIQGGIISPEIDKSAPSNLPVEWQQNPQMTELLTKVYQLVIRMKSFETDLCVRINVPMKEMVDQQDIEKEEACVKDVMEKIVASLEIKDFGLFGME